MKDSITSHPATGTRRDHWGAVARRLCLYLAIAGVVCLLFLGLWWIPKWQAAPYAGEVSPKELFDIENKARITLAQMLGGIAVLAGLYFYWKRVAAMEKDVQVAKEGQVTERFTRAIEQLANPELQVRIGAIHALEQLASRYPKYRHTVLEVLVAYMRQHAQPHEDEAGGAQPYPPPGRDVQAVLSLLCRHGRAWSSADQFHLDLSGLDLRGVDLAGADLAGADLQGSHLQEADLRGAVLEGANLMQAHLEDAVLIGCQLREANLSNAHMAGANLGEANLHGADLTGAGLQHAELWGACLDNADLSVAHLEGAQLREATLMRANLWGACLRGANLAETRLQEARLLRADLQGANLSSADLHGAYLWGANLANATLKGANLQDANLAAANLAGTDLRDARGLTRQQLAVATLDDATRLPDYLQGFLASDEK